MQVTNLTALRNIARAGARKMDAEKYEITAVANTTGAYRVTNPEGDVYRVTIRTGENYCPCKFYQENRFHPIHNPNGFDVNTCTCKHIEKCKEEEAYIKRIETEAEERYFSDYNFESGYAATK